MNSYPREMKSRRKYLDLAGPLDQVIEELQAYRERFGETAHLVGTYEGYELHYEELETDEEYNTRVEKLEAKRLKQEARERAQLKRLQEKYGDQ